MIFSEGEHVTFPQTDRGRERAREFIAAHRDRAEPGKAPHIITLLCAFELKPIGVRPSKITKLPSVGALLGALLFFLGSPSPVLSREMTLGGVGSPAAAFSAPADYRPIGATSAFGAPASASGDADWPLFGKIVGIFAALGAGAAGWAVFTGRNKTQRVGIDNPAISVQGVVRFVAHEELDARLGGYVTSDDLHDAETRIDAKIETNFRALDEKRSRSIGNLHEHLTGTAAKLAEKIEMSNGDLHEKINAIAVSVAEIRGALGVGKKGGHA